MKIDEKFHIIKRDNEIFLTNLENGDVFKLNDVTLSIFELCEEVKSSQQLANMVFSIYNETPGDFTKSDLVDFIDELVKNGYIITE